MRDISAWAVSLALSSLERDFCAASDRVRLGAAQFKVQLRLSQPSYRLHQRDLKIPLKHQG